MAIKNSIGRPVSGSQPSALGDLILYLPGGYVVVGSRNFSVPVGTDFAIEFVPFNDALKLSGSDWFFNNDSVLDSSPGADGRRVEFLALKVGESVAFIRSLGLEIQIEVTGGVAAGFSSDVLSEEFEK